MNISFAQQYWIQQPSPSANKLSRIYFADTLNGWASGDSGTIINTSNGGASWVLQNSGYPDHIVDDMFFINNSTGWCVVNDFIYTSSKVIKTTNGGSSWFTAAVMDSLTVFGCIAFVNSSTGFLSGFSGLIYKSVNGGSNWFRVNVDSNFCPLLYLLPKMNFSFYNAQTGFVSGGHFDLQGIVWRTTDSGENWLTFCSSPEPLKRIKVINGQRILSVGGDPEYGASTVQSYDSGKSWLYDTSGFFGIGTAIALRTPAEVWVPLYIDTFWIVSLDSGAFHSAWRKIPTPNGTHIVDAMFVNPQFGWACGVDGVLAKYNSNIIGIYEQTNNLPLVSSLKQNFPNPFNPVTTIKFYLAISSKVKITIFDITGREIKDFEMGNIPSGEHNLTFSATSYASGVYLYKITAEDAQGKIYTESKKMVLLK